MKRQLERLKGKRLVTGDANLMTKNEICINATSDGGVEVKEIGVDGKIKQLSGSSGSSSSDGEYYKFITHNSLNDMKQLACLFKYKNMIASEHIIESSDIYTNYNNYKAFCFMPINICTSEGCRYIKSLITFLKEAHGIEDMSAIGIQPITKEEFYDLNNI